MKPRHIVVLGAIAFLVAWLLPVIKDGVTLPDGLPGWQAFRVAASPVWPYDNTGADSWHQGVLASASAATNLVMLLLLFAALRAQQNWARRGAIAAFVCFLVNAQWVAQSGREDLRVGYYLWWISFLIVAYGLFRSPSDSTAPK